MRGVVVVVVFIVRLVYVYTGNITSRLIVDLWGLGLAVVAFGLLLQSKCAAVVVGDVVADNNVAIDRFRDFL